VGSEIRLTSRYKRLLAAWRILIGVWIPSKFEMSIQSFTEKAASFAPNPPKVAGLPPTTQPEKYTKPQHLPSRRLVRNVLRTRLEAVRQLANVLYELEEKDIQLDASYWLAEAHGGEVLKSSAEHEQLPEWERPLLKGKRGGREVVGYLRNHGARLGSGKAKDHWAATSGDEGGGSE
jgi:glycerol-3-phosphate O-acyltransferase/dihydroxyacetone phosphate acyltransferase